MSVRLFLKTVFMFNLAKLYRPLNTDEFTQSFLTETVGVYKNLVKMSFNELF